MYVNAYENLTDGQWIKTNFHTHAGTEPNTCGFNPIEPVLALYRLLGYGALCISNHDQYTDTTGYDDGGMFLVQGVEYSDNPHMLTIGVDTSMHDLSHQDAIEATAKEGGFTILCHPNFIHKEYWPWERLDVLRGFVGIELINMFIYRSRGSGFAADTWDYLLRQGRLVYGFGSDDMHLLSDIGRSWTDIYMMDRGFDALKQAVDAGRFTVSTGLRLEYLTIDGNALRVKAVFLNNNYVKDFTYRFITENGVAAVFQSESAEYILRGEKYVRIEAIAENGMMLFTQPVYQEGCLTR